MSVWDKYKLKELPEEARAEVIKTVAHELEETERAKINNSSYHTVRGLAVGAIVVALIPISIVAYYWQESWKEVKIKSMSPMVCPAPPPCPAPVLPSYDIKLTPAAAPK